MRSTMSACARILVLAAVACRGAPPAKEPPRTSMNAAIADREWVLVALGERSAPLGSQNRPATLRFDAAASHAAGFAGCNQFGAPYTITADSLRFGPVVSTRMACADGDELERGFLSALAAVTTYRVTDSTLTLGDSSGVLARFRAR